MSLNIFIVEKTGPCQQLSLSKCMMPLGSIGQQAMKKNQYCNQRIYRQYKGVRTTTRTNWSSNGYK
jgi:hypothetical protein